MVVSGRLAVCRSVAPPPGRAGSPVVALSCGGYRRTGRPIPRHSNRAGHRAPRLVGSMLAYIHRAGIMRTVAGRLCLAVIGGCSAVNSCNDTTLPTLRARSCAFCCAWFVRSDGSQAARNRRVLLLWLRLLHIDRKDAALLSLPCCTPPRCFQCKPTK